MARITTAPSIPGTLPPTMPVPATQGRTTRLAGTHGMSLAAKPNRTPHPTHKHRDVHGRLLPGNPHRIKPGAPLAPAAGPMKPLAPMAPPMPKPMAAKPQAYKPSGKFFK